MMRVMTFHFSHRVPGGLLFSSWRIDSVGGEFIKNIDAVRIFVVMTSDMVLHAHRLSRSHSGGICVGVTL